MSEQKQTFPKQHQDVQPGKTELMNPQPDHIDNNYKGSGKLEGKKALLTGADSGIGRAAAVYFAREGADVAIVYLEEHEDAKETKKLIEQEGRQCLLISGDIGSEDFCKEAIQKTLDTFGQIDVLVNNAGEQHPQNSLLDITAEQLEKTFRTNIFGYFYMTKAALPHLKKGASIINTASITAYQGNPALIDYSATKGAIVSFTRSLAGSLAKDGIRVNGVAPGPIWTPLIPSTFSAEKVEKFGSDTPFGRAGQPDELAPAYVFLASKDSSYISGQMIHVNGGTVVNG
ncbi:SDR family oxidoreductase [Bacillus badius]|uniref:SDR family oxidoreductase n=1 Tax=Bacillus badius TaxID=1455 RepID=UPI0007B0A85A|nr:SDR family oxidoreductase [Bacillus badius]KZO01201.1 NAD(P)-dependent oxidoreductase [Bacillus badius]MED0667886.1 SDR family oxidoreductase [Bacillus badius]OCS89379.1 NAD(P)-dependent oxidoreductase [Bacillus badius]OVE51242.1 NAD(P)-dependent oxidoreductase [Bacillus badius]TDW02233.1 NAD(P)-dependent dehydrogenase (short-subunit alcohol dehydrogenase family) [Bacillus badius]